MGSILSVFAIYFLGISRVCLLFRDTYRRYRVDTLKGVLGVCVRCYRTYVFSCF